MAKIKKAAPARRTRGEAWDTIHENLKMLARRVVTAEGSLEDIQAVYNAMRVAKRYEELASTGYIAQKLLDKDAKKKEEE